MTIKYNRHHISIARLITLMIVMTATICAQALPRDTYADNSVLAEGNWVKIAIDNSGVYKITNAQLQSWGFSDPTRVHIYGYGGRRIKDLLSADNYIDDLPMVQSVNVDDGIVFYGVGPETWESSNLGTYHANYNIYTTAAYYFVSDRAVNENLVAPPINTSGLPSATKPADSYTAYLHHEINLTSPGEAGYILVGENLKTQNNREIVFDLPGHIADTDVDIECAIVSKNYDPTNMVFSVNGERLPQVFGDRINSIAKNAHVHAGYTVNRRTFPITGSQLRLTVGIDDLSQVINAWINYVSVNYKRRLELTNQGSLEFNSNSSSLRLGVGNYGNVTVWDVTTPGIIEQINVAKTDNSALEWTVTHPGMRVYAAWDRNATLPSPRYIGRLANQNLHALDTPDMVIFTLPEYRQQAERLAQIHASADKPLKVEVLNVNDVYNEFASGSADVSALRKCLKLFYDRPSASGCSLRYALLFGRATIDNRHLTSQFQGNSAYNTIPGWMGGSAKIQFSDNDAFCTDDFIAMLEDGSGSYMGIDNISVAVGRMPVTSLSEARSAIDKLERYLNESKHGTWKNSFLFLADDGDNGIHLKQTEDMISELEATPDNNAFISKVYVDAYDIVGGACEGGRKDMYRMLDEGIMWWNFCGHANNHSWTGEQMLTFTDINNMLLKNVPILMAATCDFLRWDSNTLSGGETLFHEPNGGTIATISATRPVYISDNGIFTKAMGRSITRRNDDGTIPRMGDIYRNAKNNITKDNGERISSPNRLRFVLMGDPAMPIAMPDNIVKIDAIGGIDLSSDAQITIKALEQTTFTGRVCAPDGTTLTDFNGVVMANIYDAETSKNTLGKRENNVVIPFDQHGEKLFSGSAIVTNGLFTLRVAMPGEVADNFRPAAINMYAYSTQDNTRAVGLNNDFYVYGLDENVNPDTNAPEISAMVLNTDDFVDGDKVNISPLLIARISDDVSINISAAGVGHQMSLTLDGRRTFNDVSLYYSPATDGSPSGTIAYPLSDLTPGEHSLTLRVWDTAANSTTRSITFNVVENLVPDIYKVYTDVNPARTEVKFFITHNRPEAELHATITVYDLMGRQLWETKARVPSDMHTAYPISWDLCDASGRRLPRGIYLYRATISEKEGAAYSTAAQRLAITGE